MRLKSLHHTLLLSLALLGSLLALRAAAIEPLRLDRIAVTRFSPQGADKLLRQAGVLHVNGEVYWRPAIEVDRPANVIPSTLNRLLITNDAWLAYYALGFGALQAFVLEENSSTILFGTERFLAVAPDPEARNYFKDGRLINISTRAVLADASSEIIAGFVIEDRDRAVLVRAIGPGLAKFGVTDATPDPFLSIKRNGQTLVFNDNWSIRPDAATIAAAAARVGGFPLDAGSADAARVIVLPPGAYTLHVTTAGPTIRGGAVLLEVYSLPGDTDWEDAAP